MSIRFDAQASHVKISGREFSPTCMSKYVTSCLSIHTERQMENLNLSNKRKPVAYVSSSLRLLLQVLDLEGCGSLCHDHLKIVTKLLHLKYLRLRNPHKCVGSYSSLKPWVVVGCQGIYSIRKLPEEVIRLQKLCIRAPTGIGSLTRCMLQQEQAAQQPFKNR